MATLADIVVEDAAPLAGNSETARKALTEAITENAGASSESGTATQSARTSSVDALSTVLDGDTVPEKFRGKSLKDVIDSYGNLESRLGSMANELGTQRQLTDRLLDLKRNDDLRKNTPPTREPPKVTASEILDKPAETLDRVLSQREEAITTEVNRRLASMQMSIAENTFKGRHPDFQQVVNDPTFSEWVRSSPIRLRAAAAANGGDWQIADELLSEFKSGRRSASTTTSESSRAAAGGQNLAAARQATLESSTGAGGSDGVKKGKTYRRADLMRLRIDDPESYYDDNFQAEILRAYHERRVVD